MSTEHITEPEQGSGLQRRTVLKGAAWAVPVVAAAVAVPMAAATVGSEIAGYFGPGSGADATNPDLVRLTAMGQLYQTAPVTPPDTLRPTGIITVTVTVPTGYALDISPLPAGWIVDSNTGAEVVLINTTGLTDANERFDLELNANRVDPGAPAISAGNRVTVDITTVNYPGSTTTVPNA